MIDSPDLLAHTQTDHQDTQKLLIRTNVFPFLEVDLYKSQAVIRSMLLLLP